MDLPPRWVEELSDAFSTMVVMIGLASFNGSAADGHGLPRSICHGELPRELEFAPGSELLILMKEKSKVSEKRKII